jgi:hypothetical protein
LFDLFDFSSPKLLQPPTLPTLVVDTGKLAACSQMYPDTRGNLFGVDLGGQPVDGGAGD